MSNTVARTQDEVVARIEAVSKIDIFGFESEVLIGALDYDHAVAFLKEGVTREEWAEIIVEEVSQFEQMRKYMAFAIGKCENHRGISASRSVSKLNAWTWLLGNEPITGPYAQYGAPILRALCLRHGFDWPEDPALDRMALGQPCRDGCEDGCDS